MIEMYLAYLLGHRPSTTGFTPPAKYCTNYFSYFLKQKFTLICIFNITILYDLQINLVFITIIIGIKTIRINHGII